jgi:hypothetical protein
MRNLDYYNNPAGVVKSFWEMAFNDSVSRKKATEMHKKGIIRGAAVSRTTLLAV